MLTRVDPLALVGLGALLGIWFAVSPAVGPLRLPSPGTTFDAMINEFLSSNVIASQNAGDRGISLHLGVTIQRVLEGFVIGTILGVPTGMIMASIERLRLVIQPPLEALRLTPSLVAVPFLVLWFGLSSFAQVGLIAFYTFVTVQVYAFNAVSNLKPEYKMFAASLGAGRLRTLRTVVFPGMLPELVGGLRVTLQLAWGLVVVAELIGAQRGIGQLIQSMLFLLRIEIIVAAILWVAVVAVVFDWLFKLVLYRMTRWTESIGEELGAR